MHGTINLKLVKCFSHLYKNHILHRTLKEVRNKRFFCLLNLTILLGVVNMDIYELVMTVESTSEVNC